MYSFFPLTGLSTILSFLVMTGAWLYVRHRNDTTSGIVHRPIHYMGNYFLCIAVFCLFISIPYAWLHTNDAAFSLAMAWGSVIGRVFFYLGTMCIALVVCSLVPRLNPFGRYVKIIWPIAIVIITIITAKTMVWGVQPVFNYQDNLTEFHYAPIVAVGIAILALFSYVPAVILFCISAIKSNGTRRIKSSLLAIGLIINIVAGTLHDVATTGALYAAADVALIIGMLFLGTGIIYRLRQGLTDAPAATWPVAESSNTV